MRLKSKIDKIIDAIKDTNIAEIEISSFWGAQKIKLKTSLSNNNQELFDKNKETHRPSTQTQNEDDNFINTSDNTEAIEADVNINIEDNVDSPVSTIIKAPLVGTFYESSKPGEPPFVQKGAIVKVGDTLCIVEAMKIFNTIESEYDGEVLDILVHDGDPVEFGQDLFAIKELNV